MERFSSLRYHTMKEKIIAGLTTAVICVGVIMLVFRFGYGRKQITGS